MRNKSLHFITNDTQAVDNSSRQEGSHIRNRSNMEHIHRNAVEQFYIFTLNVPLCIHIPLHGVDE